MKINRNDPCPCNSGKKFKRCCINKQVNNVIPIRAPIAKPLDNHNLNFNLDDDWLEGDWEDEDWDAVDWDDDYWTDDDEEYENDLIDRLLESILSGAEPDEELKEEIDEHMEENPDFMLNVFELIQQIRYHGLRRHSHIKAYDKARKLYQETINSMMKYYGKGKFKLKQDMDTDSEEYSQIKELGDLSVFESSFDFSDEKQLKSFMDIIIYKHLPQMNCITEEFIKQKRFKKPEKMELLNSMLESRLGLYEIQAVDKENAYVDLRNVLNDDKVRIIDKGLSGHLVWDDFYIYTRIINFQGMAFDTGLTFFFDKKDRTIRKFIRKEKKKYDEKKELTRFFELYNQITEAVVKEQEIDELNYSEESVKEQEINELNYTKASIKELKISEKFVTVKKEPTLDEWRQLYEVATRIKELAPWESFWDIDVIQLKEKGGKNLAYAGILGRGGECYGVSMYEGSSGLNSFLMIAMHRELNISGEFATLSQNSLTCYWGNREELSEEERVIIRELGYKYRGKDQWLHFRAYTNGLFPDSFDQGEVRRMTYYLNMLEGAIDCYRLKDMEVDFEEGNCYTYTHNEENVAFTAYEEPLPLTAYRKDRIKIIDPDFACSLKRLKQTNMILDFEVTFAGAKIRDDETGRIINPKMLFIANSTSGIILVADMINPKLCTETKIAEKFIEYLFTRGKPKEVRVTNIIMESYIKDICDTCGIKLSHVKRLPNMEDLIDDFRRS
jgi:hypothetical protein